MLFFFFFNDTATTEIYTLSLHDALPIYITQDLPAYCGIRLEQPVQRDHVSANFPVDGHAFYYTTTIPDRKSTRLNSSHSQISYAVFCLKKKKNQDSVDRIQTCPVVSVRL